MLRLAVVALLAVSAGLLPAVARAEEPLRVRRFEPDAYPTGSTRTGLVLAGLGTTAVWYGLAAGASFVWDEAPGADDLRIPVVGPWLALGDTGCASTNPDCGTLGVVVRAVLTIIDGVGQAGGLLIATEAVFLPTREAPTGSERNSRGPAQSFSVRPAPWVGRDSGVGLSLVGAF